MEIRFGKEQDIDAIEQLYNDVIDDLTSYVNYPGWLKGVYPAREDAIKGVEEQSLFVAVIDTQIVGTLILRHKPEDAYRSVTWQSKLTDDQVYVIYTFAVHPKFTKQGVGQALLEFAKEYGKKMNAKALRLDVVDQNLPAIHLYKKCGFQYIDTVDLGLGDVGLDWFELYEKLI